MIHVHRGNVKVPKSLDGENSSAAREKAKARQHYDEKNGKSFKFAVFRGKLVKEALDELFKGKCAYCETRYAVTQPMDVEHFRPKNEIASETGGDPLRPGYWWLAATWSNLLPSCIDCNRERGQEELLADSSIYKKKSGKGTRFPLVDESKRARSESDNIDDEEPLLLNPCETEPADHLVFGWDGLVRPKVKNGKPSPHGSTSIEVYGLNRVELVKARREILHFVRHRLFVIDALANILAGWDALKGPPDLQDKIKEILAKEVDVLEGMCHAKNPFSQMVRQVTEEALEIYRPDSSGD